MPWLSFFAATRGHVEKNISLFKVHLLSFLRTFKTLWHLTGHAECLNRDRAKLLFIHNSSQVKVVSKFSMWWWRLLKKEKKMVDHKASTNLIPRYSYRTPGGLRRSGYKIRPALDKCRKHRSVIAIRISCLIIKPSTDLKLRLILVSPCNPHWLILWTFFFWFLYTTYRCFIFFVISLLWKILTSKDRKQG